jgi:CheY-like chemotaxis protein
MILEFTVRDTGIGIPPDRVTRLFKAFSQVDSSTTRKYGGTGLGLAICQRLCDLMGGAIRVESTPGAGSEFVFTIKTEPAAVGNDSGLPPLPAPLRDGGVLCIETHPVTQARLRALFEKWGAPCTIVDHAGAAVLAAAKLKRPPALVLLDSGETDAAAPLAEIASVPGARLAMFPFGQISPMAPTDGPSFASVSKPLRTTALTHAIATLFNPVAAAAAAAAKVSERPIAEEFPLEVLLAEDNAVNQKVALRFLDRLGYRADAVANGLEVLKALESRRYDLVLMDLQMPELDGIEASRQIRARFSANRQPKIIALTANAMQGDREACLAAGMDDYVTKPVKMHEIAAAIRRQFGAPAATATRPRVIG